MSEWIKYDGTNKPDGDVLVRIKWPLDGTGEYVSAAWKPAWYWGWHDKRDVDEAAESGEDGSGMITHFMIKDETSECVTNQADHDRVTE